MLGNLVAWILGCLEASFELLPLMLAILAESLLGCWLACWIALLFGYGWLSLAWLLSLVECFVDSSVLWMLGCLDAWMLGG
jgi:hypothetical protein